MKQQVQQYNNNNNNENNQSFHNNNYDHQQGVTGYRKDLGHVQRQLFPPQNNQQLHHNGEIHQQYNIQEMSYGVKQMHGGYLNNGQGNHNGLMYPGSRGPISMKPMCKSFSFYKLTSFLLSNIVELVFSATTERVIEAFVTLQ